MKQARPKTSLTERLRDENPSQWQEFLTLERQLCTGFGEPLPRAEYHAAKNKLDTLTSFFAVENSRSKFGMSLKDVRVN